MCMCVRIDIIHAYVCIHVSVYACIVTLAQVM